MDKEEKKEKKILTPNRLATIQRREVSYQSLVEQFENGEDGLYHLFNDDKTMIFHPKKTITKQDVEEIPGLKELREEIKALDAKIKTMPYGRDKYIMKQILIDLRKDQYTLKECYKPCLGCMPSFGGKSYIHLESSSEVSPDGQVSYSGVSLADPKVITTILKYYSKLKANSVDRFEGDAWYLLQDFEDVTDRALADYPMYMTILELKIDGLQNAQIQEKLEELYGETYTPEYISTLYNKKIPKLIAEKAEEDILNHHFTEKEKGQFKKCTRCGQIKLAHPKYFSKNCTSKDGWYSICKECRKKGQKKK